MTIPPSRAIALASILSTLCGAAAGWRVPFFGAGQALAADVLPATPTDGRLKACQSQGPGFIFIPGTEVCLRAGGYLWAEGYYNTFTQYPPVNDKTYSISTAALILDARTASDYGTVRAYLETRFKWRTSDAWSDGSNAAQVSLRDVYVQFAGLTAGFTQSFFDFYGNANVLGTDPVTVGDDTRLNLVAYTYELSRNLSTTVSLEDAAGRQNGILARSDVPPVSHPGIMRVLG